MTDKPWTEQGHVFIEAMEGDMQTYVARKKMLASIAVALSRTEVAIAHGSNYGAYTHEQWRKLDAARKMLQEVHDEATTAIGEFENAAK